MKVTAAVFALLGLAVAVPVDTDTEQASAAKYCDAATTLCYNEYVSASKINYRIAIPQAATAAPYDIALQIVAPKATGWAGLSWGGGMTNAPITMAWPNGNNVTVSTRVAT
jgi:hypothetical protein